MSNAQAMVAELQKRLSPVGRKSRAGGEHLDHIRPIICADGLQMSVQASMYHYCQPRDSSGPWYLVEVGFPNRKVEEFMDYIDGKHSEPTDTVYGYVPLETVAEVIEKAGGFAKGGAL